MRHKCFISFKTYDIEYKKQIQSNLDIDMIDKSLNNPIDSNNEDYIMRKIREDYLQDSTVTIFLIGSYSCESWITNNYIKRELQASLYDNPNGIVGVVLPSMKDKIYRGDYLCSTCGHTHQLVQIDDSTVIKEFSINYYIPNPSTCAWSEKDRYCILTNWEDFILDPNSYIQQAYDKRFDPIKQKITVFPK